jgi:translation initiation factor 3 subunit E
MAKFDLTSKLGQYLDRHLVFPLLEFLSAKQARQFSLLAKPNSGFDIFLLNLHFLLQIYDENELLQGKLDILSKTNMLDYAIDIRKQLHPNAEVPEVICFENLYD